MTQHRNPPEHNQRRQPKALYKDRRMLTAVVLMLATTATYGLSLDESLGAKEQPLQAIESAGTE